MQNKKTAFLTEMGFSGTITSAHPNMRTEFAWMHALNATHHNIWNYASVSGYDDVFIIFPKGKLFVNAEGSRMINGINPVSELLKTPFVQDLQSRNGQVHYVQEGPCWWFNDYEIPDQLYFYSILHQCNTIFTHNEIDVKFYKGLFPDKTVRPLQTLMFDYALKNINTSKTDKVILGGNFARWYGGFQSYIVAQEFEVPIWAQESHARRTDEHLVNDITHLPRLSWNDWMKTLASFKYAVHLMPTVAAGTFSLNCAYFGIPCIGNQKVDTQRRLHPDLLVDVDDVYMARQLANKLRNDKEFYKECSEKTKVLYQELYSPEVWMKTFTQTYND